MDLLKYCKREGKHDYLQDSHGPLNRQVPLRSIKEANKEADSCYKETSQEKKCSPYNFATPEQKAKVWKYAAVNGTTNAIHYFSKEFPNLKDMQYHSWVEKLVLIGVEQRKGKICWWIDYLKEK